VVANQGHSGSVTSNAAKIVRIQVGVAQERLMPKNKKQKTAMTPSDDALKPAEEAVVLPANDDLALPGGDFVENGEGAADTDYDIGYGKPPQKSQFKKGQSGNPNGRPKGSKNAASLFNEIFDQQVTVVKNGKPTKVPIMQAMLMKLAAMAMGGDMKAMAKVLELYHAAQSAAVNDNQPPMKGSSFALTPEEYEVIKKTNLLEGIK
jgi:hypothetical protein